MHPTVLAVISPISAVILLIVAALVAFCVARVRSTLREASRAGRERELALVATLAEDGAVIPVGGLAPAIVVPAPVPTLDTLVLPSDTAAMDGETVPETAVPAAEVPDVTVPDVPVPDEAAGAVTEVAGSAQVTPREDRYAALVSRLEALAASLEQDPAPGEIDPWRTVDYREGWEAAETAAARRIRHALTLGSGGGVSTPGGK